MNVENFITDSLDQILSAIAKSKKKHKGVAPLVRKPVLENEYPGVMRTKSGKPVYAVDFDIAVTVAEEKKRGVKAGFGVIALGSAGGESGSTQESRAISRLTFRIPISYDK